MSNLFYVILAIEAANCYKAAMCALITADELCKEAFTEEEQAVAGAVLALAQRKLESFIK